MSLQARCSPSRLAVAWCVSVTPYQLASVVPPKISGVISSRTGANVSATVNATTVTANAAGTGTGSGTATTGAATATSANSGTGKSSRAIPPGTAGPSSGYYYARAGSRLRDTYQPGLIDSAQLPPHSLSPPRRPAAASHSLLLINSATQINGHRFYHVYSAASHLESAVSSAVLHLSPTLTRRRLRKLVVAMGHSHSHGGHSHGGHSHDNSYLVSAKKNDPGVRITRIGLLANLLMAIAKFVGGWTFNSKAMIADAWHSIADMASDVLTLATVSWSIKPPSDRFPLGFGKVESLGSLGVSGMLLVGGAYMGWDSAITLFSHFNPEAAHHLLEHVGHGHGHSHSHSHTDLGIPSVHAVWLAVGTILVKEWLYHASKLSGSIPMSPVQELQDIKQRI
ncbi:hypothetical protein NQ176_g2095 [Zarea fungicola]|uniref:Uncharacterized protein n=1 Tax=Zarea fungicola TaxID=93591 RepID=A0ACC1NS72_9HYPO|nr:hypothetical protein NQ176_g2095 [Lecanicillium fungicola]